MKNKILAAMIAAVIGAVLAANPLFALSDKSLFDNAINVFGESRTAKTKVKPVRSDLPDALKRKANYQLQKGIENDSVFMVKAALVSGADADLVYGGYGMTALMYSLHNKCKIKISTLLISYGADVNAKDDYGRTPLMHALRQDYLEAAKLLIESGSDVNAKSNKGQTPLMYTAGYLSYPNRGLRQRLEVVKILLENGAKVNEKDNEGTTTLMMAIHVGYAARFSWLLIDNGADVNAKDNDSLTALMLAAWGPDPDTARLLLTRGADVHARDSLGRTALMHAVQTISDFPSQVEEISDVVFILIYNGININARDLKDRTALTYAKDNWRNSSTDYHKVVKILVDNGAQE
ncbi:ankyrin repeat domain-containing protein [Elusimicrobiota bacterium]